MSREEREQELGAHTEGMTSSPGHVLEAKSSLMCPVPRGWSEVGWECSASWAMRAAKGSCGSLGRRGFSYTRHPALPVLQSFFLLLFF